jgi:uncharacterized membrane protein YeaQ/YmgE (transglycosylase-associated protein family)
MINVIVWMMVGALLGWLASLLINTEAAPHTRLPVGVGVIGALVTGLVVTPVVGGGNINPGNFHPVSLLAPLAGASLLLAAFNLFRPGTLR